MSRKERRTDANGLSGNRRVLARTRNQLDAGNKRERKPARPQRTQREKLLGLTDPSSATAGENATHSRRTPPRRSLERVVRRVTAESAEREHASHRRGNDGRCRRERLNRARDSPERQTCRQSEREPTRRRSEREPTRPLSTEQRGRAPNGPKLSDGGRKRNPFTPDATPPFAGARC